MSETVAALDADLAKAKAASSHLAATLGQERDADDSKPNALERAQAAVRAAEAELARADAAVQADQATSVVSRDANHLVDLVA